MSPFSPFSRTVDAIDWADVHARLDEGGAALIPRLLSAATAARLRAAYDDAAQFRSRVVMARHGYGRGEYQYFRYPLPAEVATLRAALYAPLAPLANRWYERMGLAPRFPLAHDEFLARCHAAGQQRPTPLLLRYVAGDYNHLHQDLYGEEVFPLQVAVLLSAPGEDFSGGEFVMTEQRPRQQSRVEVHALERGDALVFAVNQRPVAGTRGDYRVTMRHGVSRLKHGTRMTLGVIFHDAR